VSLDNFARVPLNSPTDSLTTAQRASYITDLYGYRNVNAVVNTITKQLQYVFIAMSTSQMTRSTRRKRILTAV